MKNPNPEERIRSNPRSSILSAMKPTAKSLPPGFCRSAAHVLGVMALGYSLLYPANTSHAQIANSPATGLDDIKMELGSEKHQVGVSGDFLIGYGQISLPFSFAIARAVGGGVVYEATPSVDLEDRDSTYYGGTLSYSFGQAWFFDFSYSQGASSAETEKSLFEITLPAVEYQIDDDWYQFYIRYAFPQLRGKRFSAYVRMGATYVDAALSAQGENADFGLSYDQDTALTDIQGNVGIGVGYSVFSSSKIRFSAVVEAEGFGGTRTQKIRETAFLEETLVAEGRHELDNLVYGGLGRFSLRFEFFPGESRRLRIFADGGVQYRYTVLEYEDETFSAASFSSQTVGETLWGPYVKLGLGYSF